MAKRIYDISIEFGLHPKVVLAKAKELGIAQAKVVSSLLDDHDTERLEKELQKASALQMKPCLKNRRLVDVGAALSWIASMRHRIYSCPDTEEYGFAWGATALMLNNGRDGQRVPLEVCYVTKLASEELDNLNGVQKPYRDRLGKYLDEVHGNKKIILPGCAHRFYFLGTEPWPEEMQRLTTPALTAPTEWAAIQSILSDPDQFFQWPQVGTLLWPGCIWIQKDGQHKYPPELVTRLKQLGIEPDTRTNGPAIVSFLSAGGRRPIWGNEGWPIHHVFGGTDDGIFFTHSAGLVAAHPVAHHLAHHSELLKWLLWREAFLRFGFDPKAKFN